VNNQCPGCFQALFYYLYVNMHLFVEQDNSFQDLYFPTAPRQAPLASRKLSEMTQDSEQEEE
jgi:hypothetical protein